MAKDSETMVQLETVGDQNPFEDKYNALMGQYQKTFNVMIAQGLAIHQLEVEILSLRSGSWFPLTDLVVDPQKNIIVAKRYDNIRPTNNMHLPIDMNKDEWIFTQIHSASEENVNTAKALNYTHYCMMLTPPEG